MTILICGLKIIQNGSVLMGSASELKGNNYETGGAIVPKLIITIDDREKTAIEELYSNYDTEELVQCKDCKHYAEYGVCPTFSPKADWYCGNGERKEQ